LNDAICAAQLPEAPENVASFVPAAKLSMYSLASAAGRSPAVHPAPVSAVMPESVMPQPISHAPADPVVMVPLVTVPLVPDP
jgi:hypothetical protein